MARAGTGVTPREVVLLLVDAAGGSVDGRTVVQKMAYFSGIALNEDLGHRAHYYGPYSREVEHALVSSAMSGDLDELVQRYPSWRGSGPDIRKYTYSLTDQGKEVVADLRRDHPAESTVVDDVVSRIDAVVPSRDQQTLSLAAKTDLIVRQERQDAPVAIAEIPKLASELNWELSEADVEQAAEVLAAMSPGSSASEA